MTNAKRMEHCGSAPAAGRSARPSIRERMKIYALLDWDGSRSCCWIATGLSSGFTLHSEADGATTQRSDAPRKWHRCTYAYQHFRAVSEIVSPEGKSITLHG